MIPKAKRKRYQNYEVEPLPKNCKLIGFFNGLDIEIYDKSSIKILNDCGSYGTSSLPRQAISFFETAPFEKVSKAQYMRKLEWKEKFGNNSKKDEQTGTIIVNDEIKDDPFPIQRSQLLFIEEAMFLHKELKCLDVKDLDDNFLTTEDLWNIFCKVKENFIESYVAYLYLKSKNWVIKSGIKFGGQFILYKQSPRFYHATYIVKLDFGDGRRSQCEHLTNERIAETTKKAVLYLEIYHPNDINSSEYFTNLDKFHVKEALFQRYHIKQI